MGINCATKKSVPAGITVSLARGIKIAPLRQSNGHEMNLMMV